jgi:hypothetical protein
MRRDPTDEEMRAAYEAASDKRSYRRTGENGAAGGAGAHNGSGRADMGGAETRTDGAGNGHDDDADKPSGNAEPTSDDDPLRPYPIERLKGVIGRAATDVVHLAQCDPSMAAGYALFVSAFACQGRWRVGSRLMNTGRGKDIWKTYPTSLFVFILAKSGERKSEVASLLMEESIHGYERALKEWHRADLDAFRLQHKVWKKSEADDPGPEPQPPLSYRLGFKNLTPEGCVDAMKNRRASLYYETAEGSYFVGGPAMKDENRVTTLSFWTDLYDGAPVGSTRRMAGDISIYGRAMSVCVGIQPRIAASLFANADADDQGALNRMTVLAPRPMRGTRVYGPRALPEGCGAGLAAFSAAIRTILDKGLELRRQENGETERNELDCTKVWLSAEADQRLVDWLNEIEPRQLPGGDLEDVGGIVSRAGERVMRYAANMELVNDPDAQEIGLDAVERAIDLVLYDLDAARLVRGVAARGVDDLAADALLAWIRRKKKRVITLREAYREGPKAHRLRTKKFALAAIEVLVDRGAIEADGDSKWRVVER